MNKINTTPSKSLKETLEQLQGKLAIGTNTIDCVIRIKGEITKQDDFPQNATAKALSVDSVACLLRHCGITRDFALNTLIAMAKGEIEVNKSDEAFAEIFKQKIADELPKNIVTGRATGKLNVEMID